MLRNSLLAVSLVIGTIGLAAPSGAAPPLPQQPPRVSNVVPVQGWGERCRWLRERIRELEGRLYYAPPWERGHIERRLWRTREEFRDTCRRWR